MLLDTRYEGTSDPVTKKAATYTPRGTFSNVDPVYINQKDTNKRNEQVAKIDKVYGQASYIYIWFSDSSKDNKLAINFIKE
jgi:hypothetical protein